MPVTIRKITKKFFIVSNILLSLVTVVGCLVPWLNPGTYWWAGIIGLGMPVILGFQVLFLFFWLLVRSRWAWLPVVSILISIQQIMAFLSFNWKEEWKVEKETNTLRVMSWNVSRWDEYNKKKRGGVSYRDVMMDVVRKQNADVLCFQEFFESRMARRYDPTIVEFTKKMGYPYYFFAVEQEIYHGDYLIGNIIFSKYPIVDSLKLKISEKGRNENLASCDINVNGKIIRVVTTHLQSVLFNEGDYKGIDNIKNSKEEALKASKTILSKLKRAYYFRGKQTDKITEFLAGSPHPVIITGDFNDVPTSYTYFNIRKNRNDAFVGNGTGIGRTFRMISPTLRIDYILADKNFNIVQFHRPKVPYSDHYPQLADLDLSTLPPVADK